MTGPNIPINPPNYPIGAHGPDRSSGAGTLPNNTKISQVQTKTPLLFGETVDAEEIMTVERRLSKKEKHTTEEETATHEASLEKKEEKPIVQEVKSIDDEARELVKKDSDFEAADPLVQLERNIRTDASLSPNEIKNKTLSLYNNDPFVADKALAFLERVSKGEQLTKVQAARGLLNTEQQKAITAGQNISSPLKTFVTKHPEVKQPPHALRQLYQAITDREWSVLLLFNVLFNKFSFDQLVLIALFLFDALGADLKADGSSISKARLKKLIEDTNNIQAIFGVFTYFKSKDKAIKTEFNRLNLPYPPSTGGSA